MLSLEKLLITEKKAREFGFEWPNQLEIIRQVIEECQEVKEDIQAHSSQEKIQEEIGDLLHAAISLCVFSGYDLEETFSMINQKFEKRMHRVVALAKEMGLESLQGQSFDFMLKLWKKAKAA